MNSLIAWDKIEAEKKESTVDGIVNASGGDIHVLAKRPERLQLILDRCREGGSFHFVSDGSWSLHDFLLGIISDYELPVVYISTYAITETSARILCELVNSGKIRKLHILGDYRIKDRYPAVEQLLKLNAVIRGTQIHGKILIIQSHTGSLTLLGSANWTNNPRIELGVIDDNPMVATFHVDWIQKKLNNGDVFE